MEEEHDFTDKSKIVQQIFPLNETSMNEYYTITIDVWSYSSIR